MNQEIKAKWLEALRSGEYKQGMKKLKSGDNFCCLGVLCDIYRKETGKGEWKEIIEPGEIHATMNFFSEKEYNCGTLTEDVGKWAGFENNSINGVKNLKHPFITVDSERDGIAVFNDRGMSFKALADIIERQL